MCSFIGIAVLILAALRTELFGLIIRGEIDELRSYARGKLEMLLGISLLLMVLQNSISLMPMVLLVTFNVSVFGFVNGFFWSWASSMVGTIVPFYMARYWFQSLLASRVKPEWKEKMERNGFWVVFLARVMPFIPTTIINIGAGVSSVRVSHYLWSTLLGNFIYLFALSLIPLGIMSMDWTNPYVTVPVGIGVLAAAFAAVVIRRKRKQSKPQAETSE